MYDFTLLVLKYYKYILVSSVVISIFALVGLYYLPTYTSREVLFPKDDPVFQRYNEMSKQVGALNDLIVVLEGAPLAELQQFSQKLSLMLRKQSLVNSVMERIPIEFIYKHAYMVVPNKRLSQFEVGVDAIAQSGAASKQWSFSQALTEAEKALGDDAELASADIDLVTVKDLLNVISFLFSEWTRFLNNEGAPVKWKDLINQLGNNSILESNGYFTSRDGSLLFMFVRPNTSSQEVTALKPFINQVNTTINEVMAEYREHGTQSMKATLTGMPAIVIEEYQAVQRDKIFTIITAACAILLLILFWFRSLRRAVFVFIPMGLGVLWNTGFTLLSVGYLSILTSGFTAILFGLGVDYGIFLSTRIYDALQQERDFNKAVAQGVSSAFRGVVTAGGATVLIFASLMTSKFTGFAELGLVAAIGVFILLLSTLIVQPALFAFLARGSYHATLLQKLEKLNDQGTRGNLAAKLVHKPTSVLIVVVAIILAGFGFHFGKNITFDYDVLSMLPKHSKAAQYQQRMLHESDFQADIILVAVDTMEQAAQVAEKLRSLSSIAQVQTFSDLLPVNGNERVASAQDIGSNVMQLFKSKDYAPITLSSDQFQRLQVLVDNMQELIDDAEEQAFSAGHVELLKGIDKARQSLAKVYSGLFKPGALASTQRYLQALQADGLKLVDYFKAWSQAQPITTDDMPAELQDRFIAKNGKIIVYAFPKHSTYDAVFLEKLIEEVYSVAPLATGFPTTHIEFSKMVVNSYKVGSVIAMIIAILWIGLIFRDLKCLLVASAPLLIGGAWMIGLLYTAHFQYNYANIIALPLIIGLAVDYGVWYTHRWRENNMQGAWIIANSAGKSILLAASTTMAGLGAIAFAEYRGVSTMGLSLIIGLLCCVVAALVVVPALAHVMERKLANE